MIIRICALITATLFSASVLAAAPPPSTDEITAHSSQVTLCDVIDLMDCQ